MMNMYSSPHHHGSPNGMVQLPPKASQACATCKKQKRKCDKALPKCTLCTRMTRSCDYSDAPATPTSGDLASMHRQIQELKSRLDSQSAMAGNDGSMMDTGMGNNGILSPPGTYATTPASTLSGMVDGLSGYNAIYSSQVEYPLQGVQNRFPAIAFLDSDTFKHGGIVIPKPSIAIPQDVLEILGRDGAAVETILYDYFVTVHKWFPIVSEKHLQRNFASPGFEPGSDLALLFLCMKLICTVPVDGVDSSQVPVYLSTKRFIAIVEASGTISLLVLQAALLVAWYEYGQAIYPAAYMTTCWCKGYGNLLGINGLSASSELLGRPGTWVEKEERQRTWWGVIVLDRIISIGSMGHVLSGQEPRGETALPVNDEAWEQGEMSEAVRRFVSSPIEDPLGPFPRLCQVVVQLGKVFSHHHSGAHFETQADRYAEATSLYVQVQAMIELLNVELVATTDQITFAPALSLAYSTLCQLCEIYSCPESSGAIASADNSNMVGKAVNGLKEAAEHMVVFARHLDTNLPQPHDLDKVSPIVMDAIYSAAANFAWLVRESGSEDRLDKLNILRSCLKRFGTRWRNAAEYLRILEAQEFTYSLRTA